MFSLFLLAPNFHQGDEKVGQFGTNSWVAITKCSKRRDEELCKLKQPFKLPPSVHVHFNSPLIFFPISSILHTIQQRLYLNSQSSFIWSLTIPHQGFCFCSIEKVYSYARLKKAMIVHSVVMDCGLVGKSSQNIKAAILKNLRKTMGTK
jgi:hypothetical protein